ncbi:MAG: tetratricopeptide (TPR) repeat protein [Bacillariaceae sp.]|jgi:tetratricopeptide (TPR) repeat protein
MVPTCYKQNWPVVFDSSVQRIEEQFQLPQHDKIILLNQPLIQRDEEESNNLVLKQILNDVRDAQTRYGRDHEKVADSYNALGLIRVHMQRDPEAARRCHEYALTIFREKQLEKQVATTLNDIAYCYERLNLPCVALQHYEDSLRIFESEMISENNPQMISTRRAILRMQRR